MTSQTNQTIEISPSMMCADVWRIESIVRELEEAPVELLHFDLMDAHYVPNMPLGLVFVEQLRPHTDLPFDMHLMVEDNDFFVERLAPLGVQQISVHVESAVHLDRTLSLIRSAGIKAGVALNPTTPLQALDYAWEQMDFVLVMTVNPGYAGQVLVPAGIRKIADTAAYLAEHNLNIPLQVDGNVSFDHIPAMVAAGATQLVGGTSSVFHHHDSIKQNVKRIHEGITAGLEARSHGSPDHGR